MSKKVQVETSYSDRTTDEELIPKKSSFVHQLPTKDKKQFLHKLVFYWLLQAKLALLPFEILRKIPPVLDFFPNDTSDPIFWLAPSIVLLLLVLTAARLTYQPPYSLLVLICYALAYAVTLLEFQQIRVVTIHQKAYTLSSYLSFILTCSFPALWAIVLQLKKHRGLVFKTSEILLATLVIYVILRTIMFFLVGESFERDWVVIQVIGLLVCYAYQFFILRGLKRISKGALCMKLSESQISPMVLFLRLFF